VSAVGRTLAPLGRRRLDVSERRRLGAYAVLVAPDPGGPAPDPGQFYMLAAAEGWGGGDGRPFVPRAFSVLRAVDGALQFMLEAVGPGTERLEALGPGDGLWVLGPLGAGFGRPRDGRRAVLCGGGVGTAPLGIWQDALLDHSPPTAAPALLGFRDAAHAKGAALLANARVATDDGSVGHHGPVTDLLAYVRLCVDGPVLEAGRLAAVPGHA
jgi:NAD(P)H-flavin reductase